MEDDGKVRDQERLARRDRRLAAAARTAHRGVRACCRRSRAFPLRTGAPRAPRGRAVGWRGVQLSGPMRSSPVRKAVAAIVCAPIHAYRYAISPMLPPSCRYFPSCSEYALEAIRRHGPLGGGWLAMARICRCHPWSAGGLDPVPERLRGGVSPRLSPEPFQSSRRAGVRRFTASRGGPSVKAD